MQLTRKATPRQLISLVPMIDVLLILLVFFMVTSTYLNLNMVPIVDRAEQSESQGAGSGTTLLVRIDADGATHIRGQLHAPDALVDLVRSGLAENPLLSVVLLPSSRATTQALVGTMDMLTTAGATRLRLMRLEGQQ